MSNITATLVSGETAVVGVASSREAYEVEVTSGVRGDTGVGVVSAIITDGMLNLTLSNTAVINAGSVVATPNTGTITFTDSTIGQFSNGAINISTDDKLWTFGSDGTTTIPGGIYANGSVGSSGQVLTTDGDIAYWADVVGGNANTGNIMFSDTTITTSVGSANIILQTYNTNPTASPAITSSSWEFDAAGVLSMPGTLRLPGSVVWPGGSSVYEDTVLALQGSIGVVITSPGDTTITTGTSNWTFSNNVVRMPGGIELTASDNGVFNIMSNTYGGEFSLNSNNIYGGVGVEMSDSYLYSGDANVGSFAYTSIGSNGTIAMHVGGVDNSYDWSLNTDGTFKFPDGTLQTTAYTGNVTFDQVSGGVLRITTFSSATNAIHEIGLDGGGNTGVLYYDLAANAMRGYANGWLTFATTDSVSGLTSNNAVFLNGVAADQYAYANQLSISSLSDVNITGTIPTGYVLKWNGTAWAPGTDATTGGGGTDADTLDGQHGEYYLNYANFSNTPNLEVYVTTTNLSSNLANYATTTSLSGYVTTGSLSSNLANFVTTTDLSSSLSSYVTSSSLSSNLANYVTASSLSSNLSSYVTTASLSSNLANYVTSTSLSSNLASYATTASLSSYVTTAGLSSTLDSYVTTTSLSSNLANFVTTTSLSSNLANYVTLSGLSANVAKLSANNSTNLNGQPASFYVYALPQANSSTLGGVKVDGATVSINATSGVLSTTQNLSSTGSVTFANTTVTNNLTVSNTVFAAAINETFSTYSTAITGSPTITFDCTAGNVWNVTSAASSNWTANFTNLALVNNYTTGITMIVNQGATAYIPTAIQLEGTAVTINWQGGATPTGSPNKKDVFAFSALQTGANTYLVFGQMVTFG